MSNEQIFFAGCLLLWAALVVVSIRLLVIQAERDHANDQLQQLRKQVDDQATQIDLLKQRERDLTRQLRPLRAAHSLGELENAMRSPRL